MIGPLNPAESRFLATTEPTEGGRWLAPISAIDFGEKKASMFRTLMTFSNPAARQVGRIRIHARCADIDLGQSASSGKPAQCDRQISRRSADDSRELSF